MSHWNVQLPFGGAKESAAIGEFPDPAFPRKEPVKGILSVSRSAT